MLQLVAQPATAEDETLKPYKYTDEWSVVSAPPPAGPYRSVNIDPRVPGAGAVAPMPVIQPLEAVAETPVADETQEAVISATEDAAAVTGIEQAQSAEPAQEAAIMAPDESTAVVSEIQEAPVVAGAETGVTDESAAEVAEVGEADVTEQMPDTADTAAMDMDAAGIEAAQEPAADQAAETAVALPEEAMKYPPAAGIPAPLPEAVSPSSAASDAMQQYRGSRMPAPGYYGRSMRQPPVYSYPATGRYPRQAGYPGYGNVPPYGYYNPPVYSQEPEVPPPPVYDRQRLR
jgi:hypothetical protein